MRIALSLPRFRELRQQFPPPTLIDARGPAAFERDAEVIPGAIRVAPGKTLGWNPVALRGVVSG